MERSRYKTGYIGHFITHKARFRYLYLFINKKQEKMPTSVGSFLSLYLFNLILNSELCKCIMYFF